MIASTGYFWLVRSDQLAIRNVRGWEVGDLEVMGVYPRFNCIQWSLVEIMGTCDGNGMFFGGLITVYSKMRILSITFLCS
jgi:hypothetical protein